MAVSFNKLKESSFLLGSVNTVKNYVEYLGNSWLVFTTNVYDFSVKRQQAAEEGLAPSTPAWRTRSVSPSRPTPASYWRTWCSWR